MKRAILLASLILALLPSHGSVYKGQKEYMKKCKKCHHSGGNFAQQKTASEWKNLLNDTALLLKLHQKTPKAAQYFQSKRFEKKRKHLIHFFTKYASDSGNVPACSD